MSLSKKQIVGIGCGCAFLAVTGLLGYMFYDAYSARSAVEQGGETTNEEGDVEDVEGLEAAKEAIRGYYNAPVFPSKKAQASVKSNETAYAEWCTAALKEASRGDLPLPPPESPSVFRQRLSAEADRLRALPGGVSGHIAKPEFFFGFDQYLAPNGVLPQSADVPRLASQLATICRVVEHCAQAGALEVTEITRVEAVAEEEDESAKRAARNKKKKDEPAGEMSFAPAGSKLEYRFKVNARPAAVVQILNNIASDTRFMVVKSFSLRETSDMIMNNIGSRNKAREEAASGGSGRSRRRGRRSAQLTEEAAPAEGAAATVNRLVVDPELDDPIELAFTLAVYDFGLGKDKIPVERPVESITPSTPPAAELTKPAAAKPAEAAPAAAAEGKEAK
jgi:hypothetical protein